jgi:hypothetical protein
MRTPSSVGPADPCSESTTVSSLVSQLLVILSVPAFDMSLQDGIVKVREFLRSGMSSSLIHKITYEFVYDLLGGDDLIATAERIEQAVDQLVINDLRVRDSRLSSFDGNSDRLAPLKFSGLSPDVIVLNASETGVPSCDEIRSTASRSSATSFPALYSSFEVFDEFEAITTSSPLPSSSSYHLKLYSSEEIFDEFDASDSALFWSCYEFPFELPPPPPDRIKVVKRDFVHVPTKSGTTLDSYFASKTVLPISSGVTHKTQSPASANRYLASTLESGITTTIHWSVGVSDYEENGIEAYPCHDSDECLIVPPTSPVLQKIKKNKKKTSQRQERFETKAKNLRDNIALFGQASVRSRVSRGPRFVDVQSSFPDCDDPEFFDARSKFPRKRSSVRSRRKRDSEFVDAQSDFPVDDDPVFFEARSNIARGRAFSCRTSSRLSQLADTRLGRSCAVTSILLNFGSSDLEPTLLRLHQRFGFVGWQEIVNSVRCQVGFRRKLLLVENLTAGFIREGWREKVSERSTLYQSFFHAIFAFDDCARIDSEFVWDKISKITPKKVFDINGAAQQRLNSSYVADTKPYINFNFLCCNASSTPQSEIVNSIYGNVTPQGLFWDRTFAPAPALDEPYIIKFFTNTYCAVNSIAYSPFFRPVTRLLNFAAWRRQRPFEADFSNIPSSWVEGALVTIRKTFYDFMRTFHNIIRKLPWFVDLGIIIALIVALKYFGASWAYYVPLLPFLFMAITPSTQESSKTPNPFNTAKLICKCFVDVMEANIAEREVMNGPRDDEGMPKQSTEVTYWQRRLRGHHTINTQSAKTSILATGLMSLMFAKTPLAFRLLNFTKFQQGVEAFLEGATVGIQTVLDLITNAFSFDRIEICSFHDSEVKKFLTQSFSFRSDVTRAKIEPSSDAVCKYDQLFGIGENLKMLYAPNTPTWRALTNELSELAKLSSTFPAFTTPGECRAEPIGIMFRGKPGVGKSTILARFSEQIARAIIKKNKDGTAPAVASLVYQKGTSEFWDGYANQMVCAFDDFLQANPVPGQQGDEMSLCIKAINQWPFPLNMAALPLKGRFYFRSAFCVGTTNINSVKNITKVICSVGALDRRFRYQYDITLKPGAVVTPTCDPDDTWLITPCQIFVEDCDKRPQGPPISYTELCRKVIADHWQRSLFHKQKSAFNAAEIARDTKVFDDIKNDVHFKAGYRIRISDGEFAIPTPETQKDFLECSYDTAPPPATITHSANPQGAFISSCASTAERCISRIGYTLADGTFRGLTDSVGSFMVRNFKAIAIALSSLIGVVFVLTSFGPQLVSFLRSFADPSRPVPHVDTQASHPDDVVRKIQNNIIPVCVGLKRVGYGLALDDETLLVPCHYVVEATAMGKTLNFVDSINTHRDLVHIDSCNYFTDHLTFNVKTRKPSIRSHIGTCPQDTLCYFVTPDSIVTTKTRGCSLETYPDASHSEHMIFAHTLKTKNGDCGAALVIVDELNKTRLIGMHVAGLSHSTGHGFFTPLQPFRSVNPQFLGHEEIGKVPHPLHNGRDSNLIATKYQGLFGEVKTAPAAKRPVDFEGARVDPMHKAISSSVQVHPPLDDHVELTCRVVVNEIFSNFDKSALKTYSWEEAAAGIAGEQYINGVNRGASPGYPLCLKFHNKKPFFGYEGPYRFDLADTHYALDLAKGTEEMYMLGKRCCVFRDSLKVEVRSLAKVASGDTRIISGSSLEFTLVVRKYLMGFASEFMRTRLMHGGMVGINPYSKESEWIASRMRLRNKDGLSFAGDFKGFDKRQHPGIMKYIWEAICDNMPNCDQNTKKLFDTIGIETYNATHLGGDSYVSDTLYRTDGSLPSGHPLTSVLNSIYNMIIFRLAWIDQKGLNKISQFRDNVDLFVYGDDNWCAPSEAHKDFNFMSLKKFSPKINMVYTSETKDGEDYTLKPSVDCGFLKRKFIKQEDGWTYALLDRESIDDMFNWQKKSTPEREHVAAIARAALMEASAYSVDIFGQYYNKIEKLCGNYSLESPSVGLPIKFAWIYWRNMYRGHTPVWSHLGDSEPGVSFPILEVLK